MYDNIFVGIEPLFKQIVTELVARAKHTLNAPGSVASVALAPPMNTEHKRGCCKS